MNDAEYLISDLPDADAARRFLSQLAEKTPSNSKRLLSNNALLSDVTTLVSYSPLIATTLLQNPEYISWLNRKRADSAVRDKQEMLESLARFSMTHSQLEPHVVLARFRRRELMRIFLRDIRRLATIAEITEEISNLADAILEHALRLSRQELDNRFGQPQEMDERGRMRPAEFCIVSLGKLGSKELNYSSDIDLVFIYSADGTTSGSGTKGSTANKEYFSRLAESITKLVGGQGGEGAAYRVDMRLRPHGRVGPLALSLSDTVRYYQTEAAAWERQVLIRSRSSAGAIWVFKLFAANVEDFVFTQDESVENAIHNVAASKQKINLQNRESAGIDIKLGSGGIREIEFIAQALQLAYGGRDKWLRASHTLISLTRLSERGRITHAEHTTLFEAYDFLRRLEHILQMENGLQTHLVPNDEAKQTMTARRMGFQNTRAFRSEVGKKMAGVNRIFQRVFREIPKVDVAAEDVSETQSEEIEDRPKIEIDNVLSPLRNVAPRFAAIAEMRPGLLKALERPNADQLSRDYPVVFLKAVRNANDLGERLAALRHAWTQCLFEIVAGDVTGKITLRECKQLQTALAEASIDAALWITKRELESRFDTEIDELPLAVLGLGKLGGGGMDYDSDLDLVIVYADESEPESEDVSGRINPHSAFRIPQSNSPGEFFSRAVEIFTNVLSSITRDGSLYRVDLRLRPHGGKGPVVSSRSAFVEYFRSEAAIWEMLAFVKLRAVGGDMDLAAAIENETREIIHSRALDIDPGELAAETRSVRDRLEKQKVGRRRTKDIDIKYGEGGLLDVYFAVRYLQLRFNMPGNSKGSPPYKSGAPAAASASGVDVGGVASASDDGVVLSPVNDRSTIATLNRMKEDPSLLTLNSQLSTLEHGYMFISALDHNLRLTVGRTSRIPAANQHAREMIAERMGLGSTTELLDQLTLHRISVRAAFESIVGTE